MNSRLENYLIKGSVGSLAASVTALLVIAATSNPPTDTLALIRRSSASPAQPTGFSQEPSSSLNPLAFNSATSSGTSNYLTGTLQPDWPDADLRAATSPMSKLVADFTAINSNSVYRNGYLGVQTFCSSTNCSKPSSSQLPLWLGSGIAQNQ